MKLRVKLLRSIFSMAILSSSVYKFEDSTSQFTKPIYNDQAIIK